MAFRTHWEDGDLILKDHEEIRWVFAHEPDQFDFAAADTDFVEKLKNGLIEF